ncbi:MAG: MFS transporter [Bryobacterales bacterium]|nr:MFS transporter [Bryobacterales bacterium]
MSSDSEGPAGRAEGSAYRWTVCGLLFFATAINYIDRQILGILAPVLQPEIGWSEAEYGFIVTSFQAAYAIGLLAFGRILDRAGTRKGYTMAAAAWSVAAMLHGAVNSAAGFGVMRAALGFGEAGNFPAAVKAVSEWFAARERAFAVGLFNSGSNIGAIVTPLIVPWITVQYGWRMAFVLTGAAGGLWIAAWLWIYRERAPDTADTGGSVPWTELLRSRAVWAFLIARFLTDPVWWLYLYWAPKFLHSRHGLNLSEMGLPLVVIYTSACGGSVFGGWLSMWCMRRGWTVNAARKSAILVCALLVLPMVFCASAANLWTAVLILSLAAAGHQGWASNMFACLSDLFPKSAVSSVVGITGFGGSAGGMLAAIATGFVLQATGSYIPLFLWAGCAYLFILGLIHVMIPRIEPVVIGKG